MKGWNPSSRGISQTYGPDVSEQFLLDNHLKYIIRGHELTMEVRVWSDVNDRDSNNFIITK